MKNFILAILLLLSTNLHAQKNTAFRSIQQFSLLNGRDYVSGAFQSIYGVQHKSWFAGLGAGLDFYQQRTVPLFADVRREMSVKKGKVFAYGDVGYHLPWLTNKEQLNYTIYNNQVNSGMTVANKLDGGWLAEAGLGYARYFSNKQAILLSVGYGFKHYRHKHTIRHFHQPGEEGGYDQRIITDWKFSLNQFVIKAGWQF